jgi:hypothetical protein
MSQSDAESIESLVSEDEREAKLDTIRLKSSGPKNEEPEVALNKFGKPKRVMTEHHKEQLAKARVKARAVRTQLKDIRNKEKEMKKEDLLLRKLELEAKIVSHNNKKKDLMVRAGYLTREEAGEKKERKKYEKKEDREERDDLKIEEEEEDKLKKLEEELAQLKLKKKSVKEEVEEPEPKEHKKKSKKPKVVEPESDSDADTEPEPEPIKVKVVRHKIMKPVMEVAPKREMNVEPIKRNINTGEDITPEMRRQLQMLFPNGNF